MKEKIILTEDSVKNAVSYVPLKTKEEFCDYCSVRCMEKVQITMTDSQGSAMPDMWIENTSAKSRCLMTALLVLYLGYPVKEVEREEGNLWLMTEEMYDTCGMSHIVNQLDRMKGTAAVRDKVFDLLRDYRELEKKLNTAIYSNLSIQNDAANRIFMKLAMDVSAEALEEQKKALEELRQQFDELKQDNKQEQEAGG